MAVMKTGWRWRLLLNISFKMSQAIFIQFFIIHSFTQARHGFSKKKKKKTETRTKKKKNAKWH